MVYQLTIVPNRPLQSPEDNTFVGGIPKLPPDYVLPRCALCDAVQTFYFQIAFPTEHVWHGYSLAVFACTSCARMDNLIPELLQTSLINADIPEGFLEGYQKNFRFLVFETELGSLYTGYQERVRFSKWKLEPFNDPEIPGNKIGGQANWLLEDESPSKYARSIPMAFLMQLIENFHFPIVSNAPRQAVVDFSMSPPGEQPSPNDYYELFLGSALYLFGTDHRDLKMVYAVVQSD